jgi:hypothetical protein
MDERVVIGHERYRDAGDDGCFDVVTLVFPVCFNVLSMLTASHGGSSKVYSCRLLDFGDSYSFGPVISPKGRLVIILRTNCTIARSVLLMVMCYSSESPIIADYPDVLYDISQCLNSVSYHIVIPIFITHNWSFRSISIRSRLAWEQKRVSASAKR